MSSIIDKGKRLAWKTLVLGNILIVLMSVELAGITTVAFACSNPTSITVSTTADSQLIRAYDWDLAKVASPEVLNLFPGDQGTTQYTVSVIKKAPTDSYKVSGTMTVANTGSYATEGLKIDIFIEYKPSDRNYWATIPSTHYIITNPLAIPAGKSGSYNYEIAIPQSYVNPSYAYRANATATIMNHAGPDLGKAHVTLSRSNFSLPNAPTAVNYDTITVTDTNGESWSFSDSGSQTYPVSFMSPADAGTHTNTVTIQGLGKSSSATVTVNVLDQPTRTVQFKQAEYSASENASTVSLAVTMSNAATVPVTVNYQTVPDTAMADTDFTPVSSSLTFNPGETEKSFTVEVKNDDAYSNPDKFFYAQITGVSGPTGVGTPSQGRVTLLEASGKPTIQFNQSEYVVSEDAGTVTLNVTLSGKVSAPVTVDYAMTDGTATSGEDYSPGSGSVTIPVGETSATFTVNVMNDGKYSSKDEYFTASITSVTGLATIGTPAEAKVTLDEVALPPTIRFEQTSYAVGEGVGIFFFNVVLSQAFDQDVFVSCGAGDGTAKGHWDPELGDFLFDTTPHQYDIKISAGSLVGTDSIQIVDDQLYEGDEYFDIGIGEAYYKIYEKINDQGGFNIIKSPIGVEQPNPVPVTIIDNDIVPPTVRLEQTAYTVSEGVGEFSFNVVLSHAFDHDVLVNCGAWDGTATGHWDPEFGDYLFDTTPHSYDIRIPAGSLVGTDSIQIVDDQMYEGDEYFNIGIGEAYYVIYDSTRHELSLSVEQPDEAPVTIVDNDARPEVQFKQSDNSVSENGGNAVLDVTLSGQASALVVVHYQTHDGSAKSRVNYTGTNDGTITFPAGSVADQQITVPILDDSNYGGDTQFTVELSSISGNALIGSPASTRVTILEDEKPKVSFRQAIYDVGESDGTVTLDVSLDNVIGSDVVVHYRTVTLTATDGTNFAGTTDGTITFPANSNADQQISVPILKDDKYSGDPQFRVELSDVSSGNAAIGSPGTATVTIDEALPTVHFDQASYSVSEDSGKVTLGFTMTEPSTMAATVHYRTADGSAESPDDYTGTTSGQAIIPAGHLTGTIDVPIIADPDYESNEAFGVILNGITINGFSQGAAGALTSAGVTIVEDDPLVSLEADAYNVLENAGKASINLVLSQASSHDVYVYLGAGGGNATRGDDYDMSSSPVQVVIPAGQTSKKFDIPILDDNVHENDEYFNVGIGQAYYAGIGEPKSAKVTIQDDEKPTVQFKQSAYTVSEDAGSITLDLTLDWQTYAPVTINYLLKEGTAVPGEDYSPASGSLVIPAGETSGTITVTVKNDGKYSSPDEYFTATIASLQGPATVGTNSEAIVTLQETSGRPTIGFSALNYNVAEPASGLSNPVTLTVSMTTPYSSGVKVYYQTSDGTAKSADPHDYDPAAAGSYVIIPVGQTSATFTLNVYNDSAYSSPDKYFNVGLVSNDAGFGFNANQNAKVTIVEGDAKPSVAFKQAAYTVDEYGSNALLDVTLSGPVSDLVVVHYQTVDGTAKSGVNFMGTSDGTITFPAGSSADQQITVPILGDLINGGNTQFTVELISVSSANALIGSPATATVTIQEDNRPTVSLAQDAYTVGEGVGQAQVTLTLSHVWNKDVYVTMYTADGTAIGGDFRNPNSDGMDYYYQLFPDYSPVKISAGQQTVTFGVSIVDDQVAEGDEFFTAGISNAYFLRSGDSIDHANRIAIGTTEPTSATVTIMDNDGPKVQFKQAAYTVSEDGLKAVLDVTLSGPASEDVVVNYETHPGTALAGVNYTAVISSVTFPAGSTASQEISVAILDDTKYGRDSFFFVNLTGVSSGNADIGSPETAMVTINENDPYTIKLYNGWTLISFPLQYTMYASDLVGNANLGVNMVSRFNPTTQSFESYYDGAPNDFLLTPDVGYFVLSNRQSSFDITGPEIAPHNIEIVHGFNLIGWSSFNQSNAGLVISSMSDITMVSMFNPITQSFESYYDGVPGNFAVEDGQGYYILSGSPTAQQLYVGGI